MMELTAGTQCAWHVMNGETRERCTGVAQGASLEDDAALCSKHLRWDWHLDDGYWDFGVDNYSPYGEPDDRFSWRWDRDAPSGVWAVDSQGQATSISCSTCGEYDSNYCPHLLGKLPWNVWVTGREVTQVI